MVSVEEAQLQLAEQRQQFEEAKRQLEEEPTSNAPSQTELRRATVSSQVQARADASANEAARQKALQQLESQRKQFEADAGIVEGQISSVQSAAKEAAEWEQARKLIIKGKEIAALASPSLMSKIRKLKEGIEEPTYTTVTTYDVPRTVINTEGTFAEYRTGERQTISPETIKQLQIPSEFLNPPKKDIILPYQQRGTAFIEVKPSGAIVKAPTTQIDLKNQPMGFFQFSERVPSAVGKFVGEAIKKTNLIEYTEPARTISYPQRVTTGGEFKYTVPERKTSASEFFGDVAATGISFGAYAIPVAGTFFIGSSGIAGTQEAFNKELSTEERIFGGMKAIGSASILGIQGYSYLTKPQAIYIKKPVKTGFIERQYVKEGKVFSTYILKQQRQGVDVIANTRIRNWLGLKPVVSGQISKDITYVTKVIGSAELDKPFIVKSYKQGSPITKFTLIGGKGKPFTPESWNFLSKQEKYIWQTIAERQLGKPVPMKFVPSLLNKQAESFEGSIFAKDLMKYSLKGKNLKIDILTGGKTESRFLTGTIQRKIIPSREAPIDLYYSETYFKDVTFPMTRAAGKVPVLKGYTFRIKKPVGESFAIGKPAELSFKETSPGVFQVQPVIQQSQQAMFIGLPKIATRIPRASIAPSLKAPTTSMQIRYAPQELLQQKSAPALQLKQPDAFKIETRQQSFPKEITKTTTLIKQPQSLKQPQSPSFKQPSALKTPQSLKQPQLLKQPQALKQSQKTEQSQMPFPRITKIPATKQSSAFGKAKIVSAKLFAKQSYEVQLRRRGKFFAIGRGLPYGKALKLGAERTKTTLAATFRLIPKGTTAMEDIYYAPPSNIFASPKKPIGRIAYVERLGKRLSTRSEVMEIKTFRRSKSRRFRLF
jgi:hypothetical protein